MKTGFDSAEERKKNDVMVFILGMSLALTGSIIAGGLIGFGLFLVGAGTLLVVCALAPWKMP